MRLLFLDSAFSRRAALTLEAEHEEPRKNKSLTAVVGVKEIVPMDIPHVPAKQELFRFGHPSRRRDCNRLRRIAMQNEIDEEAKIAEWVQLGEHALTHPVALSKEEGSALQVGKA